MEVEEEEKEEGEGSEGRKGGRGVVMVSLEVAMGMIEGMGGKQKGVVGVRVGGGGRRRR